MNKSFYSHYVIANCQFVFQNGEKQYKNATCINVPILSIMWAISKQDLYLADDLVVICYSEQAGPHSPSAVLRMDMKSDCM